MRYLMLVPMVALLASCAHRRSQTVEVKHGVPVRTADARAVGGVKISTVSNENAQRVVSHTHTKAHATVSHSRTPAKITLRDRDSSRKVTIVNPQGGKKMVVRDGQKVDMVGSTHAVPAELSGGTREDILARRRAKLQSLDKQLTKLRSERADVSKIERQQEEARRELTDLGAATGPDFTQRLASLDRRLSNVQISINRIQAE